MKIIITGGKGMLGSMLSKVLLSKEHDIFALSSEEMDITNYDSTENAINKYSPDLVINCAAYTNVELAESDEEKSKVMEVNGHAPGKLAKILYEKHIGFIHISTDYVFSDNNPEGYDEEETPNNPALNYYGESKRIGEIEVRKNNPESYIVRVQWSFGPGGKNIVDTMLKLAETKTELNIVHDEIGVPTYTGYMAQNISYLAENFDTLEPGFYHAVSEGKCSRYEQVQYIYEVAGINMKLNPIKLSEYPRKAKVPNFSILKNNKLPKLPDWKEGIKEYINSIK